MRAKPQKQDPEHGLGYLDRESPLPLPRTFEVTKAWAQLPQRRELSYRTQYPHGAGDTDFPVDLDLPCGWRNA